MLDKNEILNLLKIALIDFNNEILDNIYLKGTNALRKDNTEYYSPTNNYNPSTKKYVDDLISEIDYKLKKNSEKTTDTINETNVQVTKLKMNSEETNNNINEINIRIAEVVSKIEEAANPFLIINFISNKSILEKGNDATINLSWSYSKQPDSQSINNSNIEKNIRSITYEKINNDISYTLKAIYNNSTFYKNVYISFCNGIYYGVSNSLEYNSNLINSLPSKILSNSKNINFSVNATNDEYIFYCLPSRFNDIKFLVNGFEGGFNKVMTISFTNNYNFTEDYDIYKSTNSNLGDTNVSVL